MNEYFVGDQLNEKKEGPKTLFMHGRETVGNFFNGQDPVMNKNNP